MPAEVALAPAAAAIETIAAGEYERVHWTPAGSLPAGEVKVRLNVALPPAAAVPDESARVSCAERWLAAQKNSVTIERESPQTSRLSAHPMTSAIPKSTLRNLVILSRTPH